MLDEILKQSKEYRQKVAVLATFVVGIAIFSAWLLIAGYSIKKNTLATINSREEEQATVQQFKQNLPSLRQNEVVVTELAKQGAKAGEVASQEKKKSLLDKIFGKK